jgi:hypothetical protein
MKRNLHLLGFISIFNLCQLSTEADEVSCLAASMSGYIV